MAEMDMNIEQIIWNDTEYKLKFVLDNPNFELPQIVRVVQGHMVDEDDSIASGQVLTLHGQNTIEDIVGNDLYEKEVKIPINCPYKVKIISFGNPRRFTSVNELCFCENPPKFVLVEEALTAGDDTTFETNTKFEILDHVIAEDGAIIGINCRLVNDDEKNVITLPMNLSAIFLETISPEIAMQRLLISELLREYKLPIEIQFLPVTDRNCVYGPQLGIIALHKKSSTKAILSTAVIDGTRHAITFSADLPITIQVATEILDNRCHHYAGNVEASVDLKKFNYFSSPDPYSPMNIQNKRYEDLQTPILPQRREHRNETSSFTESPARKNKSLTNGSKKRNISIDFGKDMKDLEKFFRSKLSFSSFRKKCNAKHRKESEIECDVQSTKTFKTSEDGDSSTGISSIDMRSNESDRTCNEAYIKIADDCMDSLSFESQSVPSVRRRNSRGSGDSGICLSGRKQSRSNLRFRSRSCLTPDVPFRNPSDTTFDEMSEWSVPVAGDSRSERKHMSSHLSSASYLWSAGNVNDRNNNTSSEPKEYKADFMENTYSDTTPQEDDFNACPLTAIQIGSREEIRKLSEQGVQEILKLLKLDTFNETFQENQINGELLLVLELNDLVELKMSLFQAKKIAKYIKGWRPEWKKNQAAETSRRNSLNPRDWSESDVLINMTTINLPDFGRFCSMNQVNGDLLLDILDKETLDSLKNNHGVKMSNLESKKLLNFVVKGWRPDNSPKRSPLSS